LKIDPTKLVEIFKRLPQDYDLAVLTSSFAEQIRLETYCSTQTAYTAIHNQPKLFKIEGDKTWLIPTGSILFRKPEVVNKTVQKQKAKEEEIFNKISHRKAIEEAMGCLESAIPVDGLRPDIIGFPPNIPIYAIEVETRLSIVGKMNKLVNYKNKQTAIKYVIFVDLHTGTVSAVNIFEPAKDVPEFISEIMTKIQSKLFSHLSS